MDDSITIQEDSGRYLQEYIQSLENLPSEIQYHWAEIRNRYDRARVSEKRIRSGQHDLAKIHRQWFSGHHDPAEKRDKLFKNQPVIIKRIHEDYHQLHDLANERVSLAEEALRLVDRHLSRLQKDLDQHDLEHPELAPPPSTTRTGYAISHHKRFHEIEQDDDDDDDEEEEEDSILDEESDQEDPIKKTQEAAIRNQKRKKDEPLYCYCQQVSYGEMVACDGENCPFEWFHMECVGLDEPPKGAWFCQDCSAELRKRKQSLQNMSKKIKKRHA